MPAPAASSSNGLGLLMDRGTTVIAFCQSGGKTIDKDRGST